MTVGLDFGTHQSKVCIEDKVGVELSYEFFKFSDIEGKEQYTLPSIIQIKKDGTLSYGYVSQLEKGKIIRYFKQATFTSVDVGLAYDEPILFSIWYIAYILFELEEIYGKEFSIQMGVPTDGAHFLQQKELAVRILLSAYQLVEEVFENDKIRFLNTSMDDLKRVTDYVSYSDEAKIMYGLLIFPEAYACLMPLVKSSKISTGMSLMVDIGGGTTDISFFTIKEGKPQVYDFYSINKGLNFLTNVENKKNKQLDSKVNDERDIKKERRERYRKHIMKVHNQLIHRLEKEFPKRLDLKIRRLMQALQSRPIVYSGGGSTFDSLRVGYGGFQDIIHVSEKEWRTEVVKDMYKIKALGLCPILSTAYGLSIGMPDDDVRLESFEDIYSNLREYEPSTSYVVKPDYMDDAGI